MTPSVPKLSLHKSGKYWWIVGLDPSHGPYKTKSEASEDMAGLKRFFKHGEEPGYLTTDRKKEERK